MYSIYLLFNQKDKSTWKGVEAYTKDENGKWNPKKLVKQEEPQKSNMINRVQAYIPDLEKLVLSETRIVRRIAVFVYAAYHRKIKKQFIEKQN